METHILMGRSKQAAGRSSRPYTWKCARAAYCGHHATALVSLGQDTAFFTGLAVRSWTRLCPEPIACILQRPRRPRHRTGPPTWPL